MAGVTIHPGQIADIGISVANTGSEPVTVTHAVLIAVPGLPRPRLLHSGLARAKVGGGMRNWPPTGVGGLRPLVGATLPPGRSWLWMGITGTKPGTTYGTAGLRLTYSLHGETHRVAALGGGTACVLVGRSRPCPQRLTQPVSRRVLDYIESR